MGQNFTRQRADFCKCLIEHLELYRKFTVSYQTLPDGHH